MDDRHSKKHSRKNKDPKPVNHPSPEEKEAMTASLEKARLKEVQPAQPTPLAPSPSVTPPVVDSGTAAPCPSAVPKASHDYDYGDRYGGYQPTRFNSSAVDNEELDARNE
jgi:hypothetical protein